MKILVCWKALSVHLFAELYRGVIACHCVRPTLNGAVAYVALNLTHGRRFGNLARAGFVTF
jgi:hypothetical protein